MPVAHFLRERIASAIEPAPLYFLDPTPDTHRLLAPDHAAMQHGVGWLSYRPRAHDETGAFSNRMRPFSLCSDNGICRHSSRRDECLSGGPLTQQSWPSIALNTRYSQTAQSRLESGGRQGLKSLRRLGPTFTQPRASFTLAMAWGRPWPLRTGAFRFASIRVECHRHMRNDEVARYGATHAEASPPLIQVFNASWSFASCSVVKLVRRTLPPKGAMAGSTLSAVTLRTSTQSAA
jgi:hypothetical protein